MGGLYSSREEEAKIRDALRGGIIDDFSDFEEDESLVFYIRKDNTKFRVVIICTDLGTGLRSIKQVRYNEKAPRPSADATVATAPPATTRLNGWRVTRRMCLSGEWDGRTDVPFGEKGTVECVAFDEDIGLSVLAKFEDDWATISEADGLLDPDRYLLEPPEQEEMRTKQGITSESVN